MAPTRKLTGAQGRLFAEICLHYIDAANEDCNDQPRGVALFSKLSPHQRIHLVKDVMVGILCEDEPLPPNTIQHRATFRALIEILFTELEVENDMQYDIQDVSEDLVYYDDNDDTQRKAYSQEEREKNQFQSNLIEHRADRNMTKMKRKTDKDIGEFVVDEAEESRKRIMNSDSTKERAEGMMKDLFSRGPVPRDLRNLLNRRELTRGEKRAFRYRKLCDAALQEDFSFPFPLAMVDFDWRCSDLNKWFQAINLMFDTTLMQYGSATDRALIFCELDANMYADPQQLPRIRALENHVKILRAVYESKWDPAATSYDELYIRELAAASSSNINDDNTTNCYQTRYDKLRCNSSNSNHDSRDLYDNNLKNVHPKEWTDGGMFSCTIGRFDGVSCYACYGSGNLKSCTRCQVAVYCSKECQRNNWPLHKKQCVNLAEDRKKKKKIAEMATKKL